MSFLFLELCLVGAKVKIMHVLQAFQNVSFKLAENRTDGQKSYTVY